MVDEDAQAPKFKVDSMMWHAEDQPRSSRCQACTLCFTRPGVHKRWVGLPASLQPGGPQTWLQLRKPLEHRRPRWGLFVVQPCSLWVRWVLVRSQEAAAHCT